MEWLGLGSTVFQLREAENTNAAEGMGFLQLAQMCIRNNGVQVFYCTVFPVAEEAEMEEEDLIEIAEEADLIQEERMIEDNWTVGPTAGRQKGDQGQAVRAVEDLLLAMNLDKVGPQAEQSGDLWQVKIPRISLNIVMFR